MNSSLTANDAWFGLLDRVLTRGRPVSPRGLKTFELPQFTISVDTRRPVITIPDRKLNYRFMAAEARWIMSGDNRVETIAKYNRKIADFSDDGVTFYGAYGPRWTAQRGYVVDALVKDLSTRQAGATLWRQIPVPSRDIPCTVALFFMARAGKLNAHVFMRSNDVWLGTPYDVFNFSMLTHEVCGCLNEELTALGDDPIAPGILYLTAASSHLYESNWEDARRVLRSSLSAGPVPRTPETPDELWHDPSALLDRLTAIADQTRPDARWWEVLP